MPLLDRASIIPDTPPSEDRKPAIGYTLAILAAMSSAIAWITAKPVLDYLDPLSFSVAQFALAAVLSFLLLAVQGKLGQLRQVTGGQWTFLAVVSLLSLSAVYTMYIGLSRIPATSASLLSRVEILITVFLGMALLGDRITRREFYGALVMFAGVVIIRYQAPPEYSAGFWMMILSAALLGFTEVMIKSRVHTIPPDVFALARNFIAFVFCFAGSAWRVMMQETEFGLGLIDWDNIVRGWPLVVITAVAGPFLARTVTLHALRNLEISRVVIIRQFEPFFVAVFASFLLHALPSKREWMGGLLILAGSLLLVHWRKGVTWWRSRRDRAGVEFIPPPG